MHQQLFLNEGPCTDRDKTGDECHKKDYRDLNLLSAPSTPEDSEVLNNVVTDDAKLSGSGIFNKNDTKNIPKNYGKAILSFILKSTKTRKVVAEMGINLP